MSQPREPPDPLIDEVRERRRELWEACGGTFEGLLQELRRIQREHPEKVVSRRRAARPERPA